MKEDSEKDEDSKYGKNIDGEHISQRITLLKKKF